MEWLQPGSGVNKVWKVLALVGAQYEILVCAQYEILVGAQYDILVGAHWVSGFTVTTTFVVRQILPGISKLMLLLSLPKNLIYNEFKQQQASICLDSAVASSWVKGRVFMQV